MFMGMKGWRNGEETEGETEGGREASCPLRLVSAQQPGHRVIENPTLTQRLGLNLGETP